MMMMIIAKKFHLMERCFESQDISKKKSYVLKFPLKIHSLCLNEQSSDSRRIKNQELTFCFFCILAVTFLFPKQ